MTSRERVLAAFAHEEPDCTPIWCGMSDEFHEKAKRELSVDEEQLKIRFGDDFRWAHARYAGPEFSFSSPDVHTRTVFGIERVGIGYGHAKADPLAEAGLSEVLDYAWPDPEWIDVSCLRDDIEKWGDSYAVMGGEWSPFWHDVIDLLGMENMYIMMYENPEVVDAVFEKVTDYYVETNRRIFDEAADMMDIFFIGNDFGSQQDALLSPDMFRQFVQPHLKRLIQLGHDYNLKVQLHSCGAVAKLIPLFLEAGLDSLHALQPISPSMKASVLKKKYGDALVLNGGVDSHHTLIRGTPDAVRQETLRILKIMSKGGGYIAGASHDTILEETPIENVLAMFDAVREFHGS